MQKADLERIANGMAQGRGEFTATDADGNDLAYNLTGAVNAITQIVDEMEKHGLAYADLTTEEQNELDRAQRALHYYEDELGSLLASFTANDGAVEDSNGNQIVDLPNAATTAAKTGDLPNV